MFARHAKNQFRLDGSRRHFMIKTTVMINNCLDLIFQGLRDMYKSGL